MSLLNRSSSFVALMCALRTWSVCRFVFDSLAGYRRLFPSFAQAEAVARSYLDAGHDSMDNAHNHLNQVRAARPSDYATLFYMNIIMKKAASIFDLGGNVGNLFYCFAQYLDFPQELRWTVYDVPEMLEVGRQLALERHEHRLRFTDSFQDAEGADVFLASGSSHYFESSLPELIRSLKRRPKYVILNRSPLTNRPPVVTIQDARTYLAVCKIHNVDEIVRGFESLNYICVGSWDAPDLSLGIPFYPEYSVRAYRGLFFRIKDGTESEERMMTGHRPESFPRLSNAVTSVRGPEADRTAFLPQSSRSIDTN
jgi:putative methyltransferase (TIGR04325 family)